MTKERIKELRVKKGDSRTSAFKTWMFECLDAIEALQRDKQALSNRLDAEIKQSNELAMYARHMPKCPMSDVHFYNGCTCGLSALLGGGK
jgi:hypothetical protein